jgi:hypothetical protein
MHAVSCASVAAGLWKGNDDKEKSPLTTLLPATPESQRKKTCETSKETKAWPGTKPETKKAENSHENQATKGINPLHLA